MAFLFHGISGIEVGDRNALDFGADPAGLADSTAAIQTALDSCSELGGGTVYLPEGRYLITATVRIPAFTSLCGTDGTVILAKPPQTTAPEGILFRIGGSAGVCGLTVWYPDQRIDDVNPYSYTFYTDGLHENFMLASIYHCTVINGYLGIGACVFEDNPHEMLTVDHFSGTFLSSAAVVYNQCDVGTWKSVTVSPKIWADAAEFNPPSCEEIAAYTRENTVGLTLGDLEWTEFADTCIESCKTGIRIVKGKRIEFAGSLYDLRIHDCGTGLLCEAMDERWGTVIADGIIEGRKYAVRNLTGGVVKLCGAQLNGQCEGEIQKDSVHDFHPREIDWNKVHVQPAGNLLITDGLGVPHNDAETAPDVTKELQKLIDRLAKDGGGVLYLPAGVYRMNKSLIVHEGIQLRGASSVPTRAQGCKAGGTVIYCGFRKTPACDIPECGRAFITLRKNAGIKGLRILCPDNNPPKIRETSYMIRADISVGSGNSYCENVCIAGASHGIDFRCDNHFVKKLVTLCYTVGMQLGGRNGHCEGCLQNGTVLVRSNDKGRTNPLNERDVFTALFDPITRKKAALMVIFRAYGQVVFNTFAYGVRHLAYINQSRNVLLCNVGADNIGYDAGQIFALDSTFTTVNSMRYNGHSVDLIRSCAKLYNRLTILDKYEENTMIQPPKIISEFLLAHNIPLPDGGVTRWILREDESLYQTDGTIPMDNPMWIRLNGNRLGAVMLETGGEEHYAEYSLATGQQLGHDIPTLGRVVCHFTGDGDDLYFANYSDGSVSRSHCGEVMRIEHTGQCGPNAKRQERTHVHQCILSPNKKYVLVCDLGLDTVFVYDRELKLISSAKVPAGHGARHSVFSNDGTKLYTLSEMGGSVTTFAWDNGTLTPISTVDVKPEGSEGQHNDSAAIVLSADGRHLYATNRFINTICHCVIGDDGLPVPVSQTVCAGDHPRDFRLIAGGTYAVCANTFSDSITLYRVEPDGELTELETYPCRAKPLCIEEIL
ncbi:MAG: beta-propeller fold lactonase family protein [Clostridia bacterium]|nr:beta-propeller fold lactonase family protein [Clostridia bacterium]